MNEIYIYVDSIDFKSAWWISIQPGLSHFQFKYILMSNS